MYGRSQTATSGNAVRVHFAEDAHPDHVSMDTMHWAAQQLDNGGIL